MQDMVERTRIAGFASRMTQFPEILDTLKYKIFGEEATSIYLDYRNKIVENLNEDIKDDPAGYGVVVTFDEYEIDIDGKTKKVSWVVKQEIDHEILDKFFNRLYEKEQKTLKKKKLIFFYEQEKEYFEELLQITKFRIRDYYVLVKDILLFLNKKISQIETIPPQQVEIKSEPPQHSEIKSEQETIEKKGEQQTADKEEPEIVEIKPVFKPEAVQIVFDIIKDFFTPEQQIDLKNVIETGCIANEKLIFKGNGNRLTDTFKKLIEYDIITGCQKQDLIQWTVANFKFTKGDKASPFIEDTVEKIISRNFYPCKSPLIKIENGQIQKVEQPRTKNYNK